MKEKVATLLAKESGLKSDELLPLLEIPPKQDMGDYAFPCFTLAKAFKQNPTLIAQDLAFKLSKDLPKEIEKVYSSGPYINFIENKTLFAKKIISHANKKDFGKNKLGEGKKICIDMSSPNIAKPFGIGHLRSTIIGSAIANISKANGFNVVKINYLGDWGTQFGKLIFAYKKWGDAKKLTKDPINHLLELYVQANKEEYEKDARLEFKRLEEGDKRNLGLWKKFKKLSLKEFKTIYKKLSVSFDVISGESHYNTKMKNVITLLKEKGLLKEDQGANIVDLKQDNLGVALIQKADGTSLYATRDLAALIDRYHEYHFDKIIYEVGSEQKLHFSQLFKIAEKLDLSFAKNCIHVSHGLYLGQDKKRLATRSGKTVFLRDLLDQVTSKALENLKGKETLPEKESKERAEKIALAALLYADLKNTPENNIIFDPDKFLSFEGDTGPYLLYSYARANSIIKKVTSKKKVKITSPLAQEIALLKKIAEFPETVKKAYTHLSPSIVANYSFELAQTFNEFYHACPVLGTESEGFRLKLVSLFKDTLKKSLNLLGIQTLEEM